MIPILVYAILAYVALMYACALRLRPWKRGALCLLWPAALLYVCARELYRMVRGKGEWRC